jgi:hypothetical protein
MRQPSSLAVVAVVAVVLALAAVYAPAQEEEATEAPQPGALAVAPCTAPAGTLQLGCPAFPDTSPAQQPDWDTFAWNSFAAANWPAVVPEANNDQRGFPNVSGATFAGAAPDDLLVWETFKEKREVFLQGSTEVPGSWNQEPVYGPVDPSVPACPGAGEILGRLSRPVSRGGKTMPMVTRFLGQGSEIFFDSLDETIEVASEALEPTAQLCNGVPNPQCGTPSANDCCFVNGKPVGPRVWKGSPVKTPPQPVLYEVKVNYDYYNYVLANEFYLDPTSDAAAAAGNVRLPFRTSAKEAPSGSGAGAGAGSRRGTRAAGTPVGPAQSCQPQSSTSTAPHCVTDYAPAFCLAQYQGITPTGDTLPCLVGSVQIKAAWIPVVDEDASRFHTAEAAFFRPDANGATCMDAAQFALVGIHIIQRIHAGAPGSTMATNTGGTFVFATWEHVDNDQAGFTYANYFQGDGLEPPPKQGFYPQPASALPVTRKYPILPGTQQVNQQVHQALGCTGGAGDSVWCNYQLVGTQFQAIDINGLPTQPPPANPNDPTNIGQPLYLANLVIETNDGLQQFQGLPPFPDVIAHFESQVMAKNVNAFVRDGKNLVSGGTAVNMGGCMGCHGVAQLRGFSFSFVLEDGQAGAGVDTEMNFQVPPIPPPPPPG